MCDELYMIIGLGDKGIIDEVEIDVRDWLVLKRNCKIRSDVK